jgi:hypothetical protein
VTVGGFIPLMGCCRPQGECGFTVVMTLPLGCTSAQAATTLFGPGADSAGDCDP